MLIKSKHRLKKRCIKSMEGLGLLSHVVPLPVTLQCPLLSADEWEGGLSSQTPFSSTVPHNLLKIAPVGTGQHKDVFFGGPVPFECNIKERLSPKQTAVHQELRK